MTLSRTSRFGVAFAALASASYAQERAPSMHMAPAEPARDAPEGAVLTLENALALASGDQPMVAAYRRDAQASEEAAVAARSLPDPQLSVGVQDFPVTGRTAFSPNRDDFTTYMIGIMREQVRRSKREAAAAQLKAEAVVSREQASAQEGHIRRDVTVAWLNAVEAAAKERLLLRVIGDPKTAQNNMGPCGPAGASRAAPRS